MPTDDKIPTPRMIVLSTNEHTAAQVKGLEERMHVFMSQADAEKIDGFILIALLTNTLRATLENCPDAMRDVLAAHVAMVITGGAIVEGAIASAVPASVTKH